MEQYPRLYRPSSSALSLCRRIRNVYGQNCVNMVLVYRLISNAHVSGYTALVLAITVSGGLTSLGLRIIGQVCGSRCSTLSAQTELHSFFGPGDQAIAGQRESARSRCWILPLKAVDDRVVDVLRRDLTSDGLEEPASRADLAREGKF